MSWILLTRSRDIPRNDAYRTNVGKKSVYRGSTELFFKLDITFMALPSLRLFKNKTKSNILEGSIDLC